MNHPTRAIVVGGSVAGLFAARVLSEFVDDVLVLERDRLVDDAVPRARVPQGRHAHVLLAAGLERISAWFPGIVDELVGQGAVRIQGDDAWWHQAGGYRRRGDWGHSGVSMTRPLLENAIRRRVSSLPGVQITDATRVDGLSIQDGVVRGVELAGVRLPAELVVDCTGRNSALALQLDRAGLLCPRVDRIQVDMAYASRLLRRSPGDLDGSFAVVAASPPHHFRAAVLVPVEGDRWLLSMAGMHADVPGTSDEEFREFSRGLAAPVITQLIDACVPVGPVLSHRLATSQWRRFDRIRPLPGYLPLGDSVCSFNPIYGQGMSSAALQTQALADAVRRHGGIGLRTISAATRGGARPIATAWSIAAGADFMHPQTTGPKAPYTDLLNRYVAALMRATHTSVPLSRSLLPVVHLLKPPSSLLAPGVVRAVRRELRQQRAATECAPVVGRAQVPR